MDFGSRKTSGHRMTLDRSRHLSGPQFSHPKVEVTDKTYVVHSASCSQRAPASTQLRSRPPLPRGLQEFPPPWGKSLSPPAVPKAMHDLPCPLPVLPSALSSSYSFGSSHMGLLAVPPIAMQDLPQDLCTGCSPVPRKPSSSKYPHCLPPHILQVFAQMSPMPQFYREASLNVL